MSALTRRQFFKRGSLGAIAATCLPFSNISIIPGFDLIIKNGKIIDGTGNPIWNADIGIIGDTIAAIGQIPAQQGRKLIDASGYNVCPGFIDIHSHSDSSILSYPNAESRIYQGITTEVTGNCGYSAAPKPEDSEKKQLEEDNQKKWTDVASYFSQLESTGIAVNHALLLGHGTLRSNEVGMVNRSLTSSELKNILTAVECGMDQGAFGISTGLEYAPGQFTPTEEIVTLARLVARRDGLYATHIRNEETRLLAAINEAIEIGKRANVRLEISHLKAAGRPNWKKQQGAIHLIEAARRSGIRVFADAYPYTAYSTGITIFFDSWMLEGDHSAFLNRLKNNRDRIRKEVDSRVKRDPGAYDLIVISEVYTDKNLQLVGKNLEEISSLWNLEPVDTLLKLVEEEETRVSFIGFGMSQKNVDLVLSNPLVMIGSDGYSMAPTGEAAKTKPHPRSYGAFARILSFYVREKKLFDLPTAVKKMTCMAADQVGIRDRGRIAKGMKADILIFNDEKIRDNASFGDPHHYSTGIEYVMVNGKMVVDKGKHTGKRAGAILRKM